MIPKLDDRVRELSHMFSSLPGKLVIISGPSAGAGKGKVISELLEMADQPMWLSVSATTRQPRPGEVQHHGYTFGSQDDFERRESNGEFLEANGSTEGSRYGTPLQPIIDHLRKGEIVLLEIEVKGARFVNQVVPGALYIFIKPTSGSLDDDLAELRRRISGRGTNDPASIERRIIQASDELQMAREYGFYNKWVINSTGKSEEAAMEICNLIKQHIASS